MMFQPPGVTARIDSGLPAAIATEPAGTAVRGAARRGARNARIHVGHVGEAGNEPDHVDAIGRG